MALQDKFPVLKPIFARSVNWIPFKPLRDMKKIVDTLDDTSRKIYEEKKRALYAGDEEVKMGVQEGRDLMSVMCAPPLLMSVAFNSDPEFLYCLQCE